MCMKGKLVMGSIKDSVDRLNYLVDNVTLSRKFIVGEAYELGVKDATLTFQETLVDVVKDATKKGD